MTTEQQIAKLLIGRCTNCFRVLVQPNDIRHWTGTNVGPFCDECLHALRASLGASDAPPALTELIKVWRWQAADWPSPDKGACADELEAALRAVGALPVESLKESAGNFNDSESIKVPGVSGAMPHLPTERELWILEHQILPNVYGLKFAALRRVIDKLRAIGALPVEESQHGHSAVSTCDGSRGDVSRGDDSTPSGREVAAGVSGAAAPRDDLQGDLDAWKSWRAQGKGAAPAVPAVPLDLAPIERRVQGVERFGGASWFELEVRYAHDIAALLAEVHRLRGDG